MAEEDKLSIWKISYASTFAEPLAHCSYAWPNTPVHPYTPLIPGMTSLQNAASACELAAAARLAGSISIAEGQLIPCVTLLGSPEPATPPDPPRGRVERRGKRCRMREGKGESVLVVRVELWVRSVE